MEGILVCLGISLAFTIFDYRKVTRTFLFPGKDTLQTEIHHIPRYPQLKENIHVLVQEAMLGPKALNLFPLFPPVTKVLSTILVDNRIVYIDLSPQVLYGRKNFPYSFQSSVDLLTQIIQMNFHQIEDVVVTVDGQLPGLLPYISDRRR